ncbi:hypothetical protein [Peribacillus sp. NPDC096540]|uniref:hypothetical protein n=1 Tax=Peribacillus sp. NPDC096540 TaxID=3390612 RepID=UPI003D019539
MDLDGFEQFKNTSQVILLKLHYLQYDSPPYSTLNVRVNAVNFDCGSFLISNTVCHFWIAISGDILTDPFSPNYNVESEQKAFRKQVGPREVYADIGG